MVFGLFGNKNNREADKAKRDYEVAGQYRQGRLARFRKAALDEISSKCPDAKFLMNMRFPSFMAYSQKEGILLSGIFADVVFPKIEHVGMFDDGPKATRERIAAIENFERLVSGFDQMAANGVAADFTGSAQEEEYITSILSQGFYILKAAKSLQIIRCTLSKNGNIIGYNDWWEPRNSGYFSKAIINNISNQPERGNLNISNVSVRIDFLTGRERNYFVYDFLYDEANKFAISEMKEEFSVNVTSLRDFLEIIEFEVKGLPDVLKSLDDSGHDELKSRFSDMLWEKKQSTSYKGYVT
jgi:hypothetical protein